MKARLMTVLLILFVAANVFGAPVPEGGEGAPGGGGLVQLLPFAAIILIFYFLILRPQSKKRKETEKMLSSIKKGDRIITIGGLHGTVTNVRDTTVVIKVDDNVKLEFLRSAVSSIVIQAKEDKIEEKDEDESQNSESGE